jgi:hypothetical protein
MPPSEKYGVAQLRDDRVCRAATDTETALSSFRGNRAKEKRVQFHPFDVQRQKYTKR